METVKAPVKSAQGSTINWTNIVGPIVSLAAWAGLNVSPELLVQLIIGVQSAVSLYTIVKGTWFSPRVLAPSATDLPRVKK
jgi:hypothetical protein